MKNAEPQVGVYASLNVNRQQREPSLDRQVAECTAVATKLGYQISPDHVWRETWIGTYSNRPVLDQVRCAVAAGLVDAIIAHSPETLSPDEYGLIEIISEFQDADIDVLFVTGSLDDVPSILRQFIRGYGGYHPGKTVEPWVMGADPIGD